MENSEFKLTGSDVFGRYCRIEMKRYVGPNEFYIHKCIRSYRSNYYRDVPIKSVEGEYLHPGKCVDVVDVITCGVEERDVFAVPIDSVEFIEPHNDDTTFTLDEQSKDGEEVYPTRWWKCARCGEETIMMYDEGAPVACPNCGAKVVSG